MVQGETLDAQTYDTNMHISITTHNKYITMHNFINYMLHKYMQKGLASERIHQSRSCPMYPSQLQFVTECSRAVWKSGPERKQPALLFFPRHRQSKHIFASLGFGIHAAVSWEN